MGWFNKSRRPVTDLMAQHKLPSPSGIMVSLLTLKIGALTPGDEYISSSDSFYLGLPVADGSRQVTIRVSSNRTFSLEGSWAGYAGCSKMEISVGMSGPPIYKTVDLSLEEKNELMGSILELRARSFALRSANRDAESQNNALDILEHLL